MRTLDRLKRAMMAAVVANGHQGGRFYRGLLDPENYRGVKCITCGLSAGVHFKAQSGGWSIHGAALEHPCPKRRKR